jgi:hypothetical protein
MSKIEIDTLAGKFWMYEKEYRDFIEWHAKLTNQKCPATNQKERQDTQKNHT